MKKIFIFSFVVILLMPFFMQKAFGWDPNWQENQRKMFEQIPVKPGDVIDKSNWEKVKDLLPPSFVDWVKRGEWTIPITEFKYDFSSEKEWDEASAKNAGKYVTGPRGELLEAATGKGPTYVYGLPFPNVDVKNDPDGALKLIHNAYQMKFTVGQTANSGDALDFIGQGGFERSIVVSGTRYYWWHRPDGPQPNPKGLLEARITPGLAPYDIKGIVSLNYRPLDFSGDTLWTYLPSLRRAKRLSGTNRSDPFFGSDSCLDLESGWAGDPAAHKWKFLDEKIMLLPVMSWHPERPRQYTKMPDGAWQSDLGRPEIKMGFQTEGWDGAAYAVTNAAWIPRRFYVIERTAKDPYYTYGKSINYIDAGALTFNIVELFNRAGEYWKTGIFIMPCSVWAGRRYFGTDTLDLIIDDRNRRGTAIFNEGPKHDVPEVVMRLYAPEVRRRDFTPGILRTYSK